MKKIRNKTPSSIWGFVGCFFCATLVGIPIGLPIMIWYGYNLYKSHKSHQYDPAVQRLYQ